MLARSALRTARTAGVATRNATSRPASVRLPHGPVPANGSRELHQRHLWHHTRA